VTYPVSLATLLTRTRQRSNLEGTTAGGFLPDAELIDSINGSIADWYDLVRGSTWGGQWFRVPWNFTTVANTSAYALPGNCASVISIDAQLSPSLTPISCLRYQEEQRNWFKLLQIYGWFVNQAVWYQLQGPNVNFAPVPQSAFAITINYVPTAPQLSSYDDTFDSINGWDEWIVLDAGIKCLIKDGQLDMIQELKAQRESQRARIAAAAPQRDLNQSEGVHETGRWTGYGDDWSY
jgi:hypothetical protein